MSEGGEAVGFRARRAYAVGRLGSSQKSMISVPAYLRYVNRRAGGQLAALAHAAGLTPTQVTGLSSLTSGAGILLLALSAPVFGVGLGVAVLLALGYALDSADGQLARVRGGGTRSGEWLDHVADVAKISALHGAVVLSSLRHSEASSWWIVVPLLFLVANVTMFFGLMLRDQMLTRQGPGASSQDRRAPFLKAVALLPIDYGTLCWVFVLLPSTVAFRLGYGFLAAYACLFAVRSLVRAYRAVAESELHLMSPVP